MSLSLIDGEFGDLLLNYSVMGILLSTRWLCVYSSYWNFFFFSSCFGVLGDMNMLSASKSLVVLATLITSKSLVVYGILIMSWVFLSKFFAKLIYIWEIFKSVFKAASSPFLSVFESVSLHFLIDKV